MSTRTVSQRGNGNEPPAQRRRTASPSRNRPRNERGNGNEPPEQSMETVSSQNTVGPSGPGLNRPPEGSLRQPGDPWAIVPVAPRLNNRELARLLAPINRRAAQALIQQRQTQQREPYVMLGSQNSSMREPVDPALTWALGGPENPAVSFIGEMNGVAIQYNPVTGMVTPFANINRRNVNQFGLGTAERRSSRMGQLRNQIVTTMRRTFLGLNPSEKREHVLRLKRQYLRDFTMPNSDVRQLKAAIKRIQNNELKPPTNTNAARTVRFAKAQIQKIFKDYSNKLKNTAQKYNFGNFYVEEPNIRENSSIQQILQKVIEYAQYPAQVFQTYFIDEAPIEPIQATLPSAVSRPRADSNLVRNLKTYVGDINAIIEEASAKAAQNALQKARNRGNNAEAIQAAVNAAKNAAAKAERKRLSVAKSSTKRALNKWNAYTKIFNQNLELPETTANIPQYIAKLQTAGINIKNYGLSKTRRAASALRRAQAAEAVNE